MGLLPDLTCVYLEVRPVCRGSERGRLCLPINEELRPGTPKWPSFFSSCSALFGIWVYVGMGVLWSPLEYGQWTKRWCFLRPPFQHFSNLEIAESQRNCLTSLFFS